MVHGRFSGFSWALLTMPLFWVCFHDICMTWPKPSFVISTVWRIIKSARELPREHKSSRSVSLRPRFPVAYLKPCQRRAGCGMSTSTHARAVASAEPSDGINSPLPSLQSNRDQGGLLGMTCEGPNGPKTCNGTQHDCLKLRSIEHEGRSPHRIAHRPGTGPRSTPPRILCRLKPYE